MVTLTEFLIARIDEDARAARAGDSPSALRWQMTSDAVRNIVGLCADLNGHGLDDNALSEALRSFATAYADHPDFDPAWRSTGQAT